MCSNWFLSPGSNSPETHVPCLKIFSLSQQLFQLLCKVLCFCSNEAKVLTFNHLCTWYMFHSVVINYQAQQSKNSTSYARVTEREVAEPRVAAPHCWAFLTQDPWPLLLGSRPPVSSFPRSVGSTSTRH